MNLVLPAELPCRTQEWDLTAVLGAIMDPRCLNVIEWVYNAEFNADLSRVYRVL